MTARDPNIEHDVRAIVERIVEGLFGDDDELDLPDAADDGPEPVSVPGTSEIRTVAIGADHGGFALKERLAFRLAERGYEVTDCGTTSHESVDYPDFAVAVARHVAEGRVDAGVMIDGAGIGSAMAANKVPGVRAAMCYDLSTARNAREHNHANMLTLGAGMIGEAVAWQIVIEFLTTDFGGDRHARRVALIDDLDRVGSGVVR